MIEEAESDAVLDFLDRLRRSAGDDREMLDRVGALERRRHDELRAPGGDADLLQAARGWLRRHSSSPRGDNWRNDPKHLDWAAQNLLIDLAPWLQAKAKR